MKGFHELLAAKPHLRRDVVWGPTKGRCQSTISDAFFAHAEVGQLDMTLRVQKNVVQFQISATRLGQYPTWPAPCLRCTLPVDDPMLMQELQRARDFRRIELRSRLVELPRPLDLEHEITTVHVFHNEEETILRAKTI